MAFKTDILFKIPAIINVLKIHVYLRHQSLIKKKSQVQISPELSE